MWGSSKLKDNTNLLTIFTPTYNRASTLGRVHKSLLMQEFDDLTWLIIDDGSTDGTEELVRSFKKVPNPSFNIEYVYQENRGKPACWNRAVAMCESKYFVCLDSDDELLPGILKRLFNDEPYIKNIENEPMIVGLRCDAISSRTQKISARHLSDKPILKSWFYEVSHNKFCGERLDVFKSQILKDFVFPVSKDVKFIPESWMYSSIAKAGYCFVYLPIAIRLFYVWDDVARLSTSPISKHAEGHYIYRSHLLSIMPKYVWALNPIYYLKTLIRFAQTAHLTKKTFAQRLTSSRSLFATCLSYILQVVRI